jgi:hypothetical protein
MKKCQYQGCTQDVNDWQTYCVKHYIEVNQGQQMQQMMQEQEEPEQEAEEYTGEGIGQGEVRALPKAMPKQQQTRPIPELVRVKMQKQPQEQNPQTVPVKKQMFQDKPRQPVFEIPEDIAELTRIEIKKVAFENAMRLIIDMADYEGKTYEALLNEARTLTAQFYRIIVEYNEAVL